MGRLSILAISAIAVLAVAVFAAGCGDDDEGGEATNGAAQSQQGDAVREEASGDAMKDDSSGDAMKGGGDAMKEEASTGAKAAMAANRKRGQRRARRGKPLKVVDSQFGRVVADGKGEAFYLFGKEKGKRSRCYGACARAWPPVITMGRPRAGRGINQRLLGVTRRKNGKLQVTYRNHPLYYYVDDSPGTILCHNVPEFGGLWLVVQPNGNPVA